MSDQPGLPHPPPAGETALKPGTFDGVCVFVTGAGTGTSAIVGRYDGITEIQPGSFLLMDSAYHAVRPEFGCSLSVLCTVISRRPGHYVLDAGSKAISQDFGKPAIKGHPEELRLQGRDLYIYFPDGQGRSKLTPVLGRILKNTGTGRNWNTVTKLLEMAEELEASK